MSSTQVKNDAVTEASRAAVPMRLEVVVTVDDLDAARGELLWRRMAPGHTGRPAGRRRPG